MDLRRLLKLFLVNFINLFEGDFLGSLRIRNKKLYQI